MSRPVVAQIDVTEGQTGHRFGNLVSIPNGYADEADQREEKTGFLHVSKPFSIEDRWR
jgi:hypothetical protein